MRIATLRFRGSSLRLAAVLLFALPSLACSGLTGGALVSPDAAALSTEPSTEPSVDVAEMRARELEAAGFGPLAGTAALTGTGGELDWGPLADLAALEFSFHDPQTGESFQIRGPYELVYWDEERLELTGRSLARQAATRITLENRDDQVWAHLRLLDREFLTRVR